MPQNIITGKVELMSVAQKEGVRCVMCSGRLELQDNSYDGKQENKIVLLQIGLPGRPLILAELTPHLNVRNKNNVMCFRASFDVAEGEPLPTSLVMLALTSDGITHPISLEIEQSVIEFEKIDECPAILNEANYRRTDVEYQAFIDRGIGMAVPQSQNPEFTIILTQGEPAHIFAAIRGIESAVFNRAELFIPEEHGELLANLRGARRYDISNGLIAGINQAVKESRAKTIVLLNPKTVPLIGAFEIAASVLAGDKDNAVVVGRVIRPDGLLQEAGLVADNKGGVSFFGAGHQANGWEYLYEHEVDVASPTLSFIKKSILREIPFDTKAESVLAALIKMSSALRSIGQNIIYHPDLVSSLIVSAERQEEILPVVESKQDEVFDEDDDPNDVYYQGEVAQAEPVEVCSSFPKYNVKARALVVLGHLTEEVLGEGRLHNIFDSLSRDGLAITVFAMRGIACTLSQLRHDLPVTVQYVDGEETQLSDFIAQNAGVYDLAVVWQMPHLRKVLESVREFNMPVVCDVSGRDIFSEMERALLRKVSAVWVADAREARRLRNLGIHHTEVVSFADGEENANALMALLPKMRDSLRGDDLQ